MSTMFVFRELMWQWGWIYYLNYCDNRIQLFIFINCEIIFDRLSHFSYLSEIINVGRILYLTML